MKDNKFRLPDAINCSITKDFTQVPKELSENPNISAKAKIIQIILLGNKEGWVSHVKSINKSMKEGRDSIQSGLKELETHGYLVRIYYREKKTKKHRGSFWAYTDIPFTWNVENHLKWLEDHDLEMVNINRKAVTGKAVNWKCGYGNPVPNNININNTNKNNKKNIIVPTKKNGKIPLQERNLKYIPLSKKLSRIISRSKNMKHTAYQIKCWANELRQLEESNGIEFNRIQSALDWYEKHIGEQYCPVIESGNALRTKFTKLEAAIERDNYDYKKDKEKQAQQFYEDYGGDELDETLKKSYT